MKQISLLVGLICGLACYCRSQDQSQYKVYNDTLGPCKIKVAVPIQWNKDLFILAHGLVPAESPLSAEFSPSDKLYSSLLTNGWMIASTSYRRNGCITREAVEDIDQLRKYIGSKHGMPRQVYVMGLSMGGAIVTLMAETKKGEYNGFLAIGAALHMAKGQYTFTPRVPLLFLSNQNEVSGPMFYLKNVKESAFKPALWCIRRDGHCNVNDAEEQQALKALIAWSGGQPIELDKDGTCEP